MLINFVKMQGLGNDFVLIDLITQDVRLHTAHIKRIADRHFGIGCDQVILIEPPIESDRDFFYRIYNADGAEVEQCGNGARCAARFFYDSGFMFHSRSHLKADCLAGPVEFNIEADESVTVNMGAPIFQLDKIPFLPNTPTSSESLLHSIPIEKSEVTHYEINKNHSTPHFSEEKITFLPLSIGNPHAVIQVSDIEKIPVPAIGERVMTHSFFPKGTNVEFMQILDPHRILLRVYERGVGETLSCGSGAAAAAIGGIRLGLLQTPVNVIFPSGSLKVTWEQEKHPVYLTGPAISVFMGRFRV